jgi:hypothetical protein
MMGNEMNFLNQHLQTTSILLQKQLDLARDSLHACSVQFARKFIRKHSLSFNSHLLF